NSGVPTCDSMTRKTPTAAGKRAALPAGYAGIHGGIVELLDVARQAAARSVNALMTASYWEIGRQIVEAEQKGRRRAGYASRLPIENSETVSRKFGLSELSQVFTLPWSAYVRLLSVKDDHARQF